MDLFKIRRKIKRFIQFKMELNQAACEENDNNPIFGRSSSTSLVADGLLIKHTTVVTPIKSQKQIVKAEDQHKNQEEYLRITMIPDSGPVRLVTTQNESPLLCGNSKVNEHDFVSLNEDKPIPFMIEAVENNISHEQPFFTSRKTSYFEQTAPETEGKKSPTKWLDIDKFTIPKISFRSCCWLFIVFIAPVLTFTICGALLLWWFVR